MNIATSYKRYRRRTMFRKRRALDALWALLLTDSLVVSASDPMEGSDGERQYARGGSREALCTRRVRPSPQRRVAPGSTIW